MPLQTLKDLYIEELKDIYNGEHQILKALPKMSKAAASSDLKKAFNQHLKQTEHQVERLDKIFGELSKPRRGKKCLGIQGLIEEGSELIKEEADPSVKDAGLIAAAQRVEHYEMAAYGTLRTYAQMLGYESAAQALQDTLDEEGETDHKLTQLAEETINPHAESSGEESGDGQGI